MGTSEVAPISVVHWWIMAKSGEFYWLWLIVVNNGQSLSSITVSSVITWHLSVLTIEVIFLETDMDPIRIRVQQETDRPSLIRKSTRYFLGNPGFHHLFPWWGIARLSTNGWLRNRHQLLPGRRCVEVRNSFQRAWGYRAMVVLVSNSEWWLLNSGSGACWWLIMRKNG